MRLVNPGVYSGLFDEGIRVEQLFLMSAGYRPFRDIFAAQGPLLLDLLHPWFVLFGQDLVGGALSVGVYSLVGLVGCVLAGAAGRRAAGSARDGDCCWCSARSTSKARGSPWPRCRPWRRPRSSVGAAIVYARSGSRRWLVACALLLAISLLIKPITLAAGVPAGLAVLSRWRAGCARCSLDGLLLGIVVVAIGCWWSSAWGWPACFDQIVAYRMESRGSEGWSVWKNRIALARALSFEPAALPWLGAARRDAAARRRRVDAALVVAWAVASVALLLAYSPLHGKHIVVMIPPLAVLVGVGRRRRSTRWCAASARAGYARRRRRGAGGAGRLVRDGGAGLGGAERPAAQGHGRHRRRPGRRAVRRRRRRDPDPDRRRATSSSPIIRT